MKKCALVLLFFVCGESYCQDNGFPFGEVTYANLDMKTYSKDTTASAVVLKEFGEAYFESEGNNNLIFEYHATIKILKRDGLDLANYEIPLRKGNLAERLRSVKASSFNRDGNNFSEDKISDKDIFTEDLNKYWDIKKFAVPNVRVGSIIEIFYVLESPRVFNFRRWEFQSNIPKMSSEYWASIPGNYLYNISLIGFLPLTKNTSELLKACFSPGGIPADCSRLKYMMTDIPAFVEEEYMLAKSNFISAINFELSEITQFSGAKKKFTVEWRDAERELRQDEKFGVQLRRGKDVVDDHIESLIGGETDELAKAKRIFDFIKNHFEWNGVYGNYSEFGIKKSFDAKKGNVGDINLALIAALRYAGLNVEPVILSTRDNGRPIEIHPVLSDFNYVIAKVNIGDKYYLLDATDDFNAFGMLPIDCINGKGRVLGEKESYWLELKPTDKRRQVTVLALKLDDRGIIKGLVQNSYVGYEAMLQRKKIAGFNSQQEYFENIEKGLNDIKISKSELKNIDDLSKPLVESYTIEFQPFDDMKSGPLLFSPMIMEQWKTNPFKSKERLYPVDFGAPIEETVVLTLEYPANFKITDLPEKIALALPDNGGRYIFEVQDRQNKFSLNSTLIIARPVYSSNEYHYLQELFSRVVSSHATDIVLENK